MFKNTTLGQPHMRVKYLNITFLKALAQAIQVACAHHFVVNPNFSLKFSSVGISCFLGHFYSKFCTNTDKIYIMIFGFLMYSKMFTNPIPERPMSHHSCMLHVNVGI
jgi:uncharacterized membrane protein YjjB (DUF3815 family)